MLCQKPFLVKKNLCSSDRTILFKFQQHVNAYQIMYGETSHFQFSMGNGKIKYPININIPSHMVATFLVILLLYHITHNWVYSVSAPCFITSLWHYKFDVCTYFCMYGKRRPVTIPRHIWDQFSWSLILYSSHLSH